MFFIADDTEEKMHYLRSVHAPMSTLSVDRLTERYGHGRRRCQNVCRALSFEDECLTGLGNLLFLETSQLHQGISASENMRVENPHQDGLRTTSYDVAIVTGWQSRGMLLMREGGLMPRTINTGVQSFEAIKEDGCFYIDKTRFVAEW